MSLASNTADGFTTLAAALKATRTLMNGNQANNNALTTAAKGSLLLAINELQAEIDAVAGASGAQINDASNASLTQTYSITKIRDLDIALKAEILGAAGAAYDTLLELKDYTDSGQAADQIALSNRLRVDAAQGLGAPARQFGRDNLDVWSKAEIGSVTTDFVAVVNAALA